MQVRMRTARVCKWMQRASLTLQQIEHNFSDVRRSYQHLNPFRRQLGSQRHSSCHLRHYERETR